MRVSAFIGSGSLTVVLLMGCLDGCSSRDLRKTNDVQVSIGAGVDGTSSAISSKGITIEGKDCSAPSTVPNASYVGPYRGVENILSPTDLARDIYCATSVLGAKYPRGFVTIFGSSRIKEINQGPDPIVNAANDKMYKQVMSFAHEWTKRYGATYPIMTGAGPGLMEAGSRGAHQAGVSIGYTTYYDPNSSPSADRPYGGDPTKAFWKYGGQDIVTDGAIFSSVAVRESTMILHSAAVVLAPGGTGTEWETFQVLETIKSKQLKKVPVFLVGDRSSHWQSFYARLDDMVRRGVIKVDEVTQHFQHVDNAEDVVDLLSVQLPAK